MVHRGVFSCTTVERSLHHVQPDPDFPFDGVSLAKYLFRGGRPPKRDLFWRMTKERALRRGKYKYYRDPNGIEYLFDLNQDVREQANVRNRRPAEFESLKASWETINSTLLPYPS